MSAEIPGQNDTPKLPEYRGRTVKFEGITIQLERGAWDFTRPDKKRLTIDTYSIWNPRHWDEIAKRLASGQRCAMYIMGNFGVGAIREAPDWQKGVETDDTIFEKIKQRPKIQNLVTFIHPEDSSYFIDVNRLSPEHKNLRWARERLKSYAGPQHNIFPLLDNGLVDSGFVRAEDQSVACFWIPGHYGYEGIYDYVRKYVKHGIFGGGSLNIHGQEPCYTSEKLYSEMVRLPEWQEGIDFVIFDEIAEAKKIGRSQTMVSFTGSAPQVVRVGSLSPEYISSKTGRQIEYQAGDIESGKIKLASSITPYEQSYNEAINMKVELVLAQIKRYKDWYRQNRKALQL